MGQINIKNTDTPTPPQTGRTGIFINTSDTPFIILSNGTQVPFAGVNNFLALVDTPANYEGQAGKVATVNALEDGLIFTEVSSGSIDNITEIPNRSYNDLQDKLPTDYTPVDTGNIIAFDQAYKYGYNGTPRTGNITISITNAKEINMAKMLHNSGTAPEISAPAGVTLHKVGDYETGKSNEILFICHKNDAGAVTRVSYSISPNGL